MVFGEREHDVAIGSRYRVLLSLVLILAAFGASPVAAQSPGGTPAADFMLLEENVVDRFVVQRWVRRDAPEVSPAGFCECVTLVYDGGRLVLDLGIDAGITTVRALRDVTGDDRAELVVVNYSGGAHCCESTSIYSVEDAGHRPLLSVATGHCPGELLDLDQDGVAEFRTCDDVFAYEFCAFAFSPMPPVVYAYDRRQGSFVIATPAFAKHLQPRSVDDARAAMNENRDTPSIVRCAALAPAVDLMYLGRLSDGQRLFRSLYQEADAAAVEQKVLELMKASSHWIPQ